MGAGGPVWGLCLGLRQGEDRAEPALRFRLDYNG